MAVTPRTFFQPFAAAVFNGAHNFAAHTFKIALTNVEPVSTYANLSQISQIAVGGGYVAGGFAITTTSSTQSAGVYKLILQDYTFSATGTVAEWQYAVLYNDTAAGDPLISWYAFAVPFRLTSGNTFLFDFDGINGAVNFSPGETSGGFVTLAVAPSSVTEDGTDNLVFTFTRTGLVTTPLTVNYTIGGTAVNGTDYATIGTTATFGIGSATTTVTVNPITDATIEPDETVILTVATGSGYVVGSPASATGTIEDDDAVTDPYWANVELLLPLDTANGLNDLSANAFTMTAFGSAAITTSDSDFPDGALELNGTSQYLRSPADAAFAFGTGAFTIECYIKADTVSSNDGIFTTGNDTSGASVSLQGGNAVWSTVGTGDGLGGSISASVRQHIALTRDGSGDVRLFIGGVLISAGVLNRATNITADQFSLGYYFTNAFLFDGRVSWLRVTKGVARYTSNFTPPSTPFPTS